MPARRDARQYVGCKKLTKDQEYGGPVECNKRPTEQLGRGAQILPRNREHDEPRALSCGRPTRADLVQGWQREPFAHPQQRGRAAQTPRSRRERSPWASQRPTATVTLNWSQLGPPHHGHSHTQLESTRSAASVHNSSQRSRACSTHQRPRAAQIEQHPSQHVCKDSR